MARNDDKFNTMKFVVTFEVIPSTLQKHVNVPFKGVKDIQEAMKREMGWLETSGIYMNQIRIKT